MSHKVKDLDSVLKIEGAELKSANGKDISEVWIVKTD